MCPVAWAIEVLHNFQTRQVPVGTCWNPLPWDRATAVAGKGSENVEKIRDSL
jgi:rubredoxin